MRDTKEYTLFDGVTPVAITSSTDATPIVVTATTHGLNTGDLVMIFGHTTNIAANGIFKVTRLTANTFSLQNRYTGADIAGSGAGAGSGGILVPNPKIVFVSDFRNAVIAIQTTGSATLTAKVAASLGKVLNDVNADGDTPNFGATQSDQNPWTFVQSIDLADGTALDGNTGIVASGTDLNKMVEVNINALMHICLIPVSWTQGSITAKIIVYDNE